MEIISPIIFSVPDLCPIPETLPCLEVIDFIIRQSEVVTCLILYWGEISSLRHQSDPVLPTRATTTTTLAFLGYDVWRHYSVLLFTSVSLESFLFHVSGVKTRTTCGYSCAHHCSSQRVRPDQAHPYELSRAALPACYIYPPLASRPSQYKPPNSGWPLTVPHIQEW